MIGKFRQEPLTLENPDYCGVTHHIQLVDENGLEYATLRMDLVPSCLIVHPHVYTITRKSARLMYDDVGNLIKLACKHYGYTCAMCYPDNFKLAQVLGRNKWQVVKEVDGKKVCKLDLKDI